MKYNHTDLTGQNTRKNCDVYLHISEIKDKESAALPAFHDISTKTKDLVEHAIELWRMEQRLNKITSLNESQRDLLASSIRKLQRYLDKNDMEIVDHTNQVFSDGRNLDVLLVVTSPGVTEPTIKETKEPTILYKNQVVHKGKVVVLTKTDGGDQHG